MTCPNGETEAVDRCGQAIDETDGGGGGVLLTFLGKVCLSIPPFFGTSLFLISSNPGRGVPPLAEGIVPRESVAAFPPVVLVIPGGRPRRLVGW